MKRFLPLFFALTLMLAAEELLPELVSIAKKFEADSAALAEQKSAVIAPAKQQYLAALDTAEKAARAAVQPAVLSSVLAERIAVTNGAMAPAIPTDLPPPAIGAKVLHRYGRAGDE